MRKLLFKRILSSCLFVALLPGNALFALSAAPSDISVDYRSVSAFISEDDYTDYLRQLLSDLNGAEPSDAAKSTLVTYVETAVSALASLSLDAYSNDLTIRGEDIRACISDADNIRGHLISILTDNGIALNKEIPLSLKIDGIGFDTNSPGQVRFSADILTELGPTEVIRVLLGDTRHSIIITADSLREICASYGELVIRFQQTGFRKYTVNILDESGNPIERLPAAVAFTLPANNELATVLATYAGGVDNWGGQYDASNDAIEFSTRFSAAYEVLEDSISISDIDSLEPDIRSAINFMVSKGYFTLDGNTFNPDSDLTKYDFIIALVKMFFALDRKASSSFQDVSISSDYYAYVASAEIEGIAKGDGSGHFNGENSITVQEVVALCARTLTEKKGYAYPEYPDEYLIFPDSAQISAWAAQDVSLAVREGLISDTQTLSPSGYMTRSQSAVLLYRLFMLLYETSPIAFDIGAGSQTAVVGVLDTGDAGQSGSGADHRLLAPSRHGQPAQSAGRRGWGCLFSLHLFACR